MYDVPQDPPSTRPRSSSPSLLLRPAATTTRSAQTGSPSTTAPRTRSISTRRASAWPVRQRSRGSAWAVSRSTRSTSGRRANIAVTIPGIPGNSPSRAGRPERVDDVGHLLEHRPYDVAAPGMRRVALHDADSAPTAVRGRAGVAVDERHVVPASRESDRGERADGPGADDECLHDVPPVGRW